MVRAIIDFQEADYERIRKAAVERGMTLESFVAAQALRAAPQVPGENSIPTTDPAQGLLNVIARAKREGWSANGPFLSDDEMYSR